MKIIFLGTPHFAENVLQKLIDSKHQVVAVVCGEDKPVGRKQIIEMPPTKVLALKHNIPVYQFKKIRLEGVEPLKKIDADIIVTAAYGQLLSQEVLDITKFGVVNVHGSVLPKYRGSSPIQWSLINGEKTLGVTILKTQIGMDDGPIIHQSEFDIQNADTVESLMEKISTIGADLLIKSLNEIENGTAKFVPQDESKATKCFMLKKENAETDFNKPCIDIVNFVRGLESWPVAWCYIYDNSCKNTFDMKSTNATSEMKILKIYKAQKVEFDNFINSNQNLQELEGITKNAKNGQVVLCSAKKGIFVKTSDAVLQLLTVQIEGGKILDGKIFASGGKLHENDYLGNSNFFGISN